MHFIGFFFPLGSKGWKGLIILSLFFMKLMETDISIEFPALKSSFLRHFKDYLLSHICMKSLRMMHCKAS